MSRLLATVRRNAGEENISPSCSREGCRVYMTDIPSPRVVVDVERAFETRKNTGKRCDFILFLQLDQDNLMIAPMELKSGGADTSEVAAQLQAGAEFARTLVPDVPAPILRPILFHGRRLHSKQRRDLNRAKVRIQGLELSIKTERCGRQLNLARALSIRVAA